VVLKIQWLRTLGTVSTNYNELFMRFKMEVIEYELHLFKHTPSKMIISHRMEKTLKKGCSGVIVRLCSMEVKLEDENIPLELKYTMEKIHRFFQELFKVLPPFRDHEHQIELIIGSTPTNKIPYIYLWKTKVKLRKGYKTCWMELLFDQARVHFYP